jgi:hypothetical protein
VSPREGSWVPSTGGWDSRGPLHLPGGVALGGKADLLPSEKTLILEGV